MEGRRSHPGRVQTCGAEASFDAILQLVCRLLVEREQKDSIGRHESSADRVSSTGHQHRCLPRPRCSEYLDPIVERDDGSRLFVGKGARLDCGKELASGDQLRLDGVEAAPGYVFGDSATGSFVVQPTIFRGASGYLLSNSERAVGFVAWGRGLRRGVTVPVMPAIDIAPTLAALLDVSLDSEGRPLYGILSFDPRNPKRGLPKLGQTR